MKRILFVDDEPRVLEGLQRLLRPQRHQWEMVFVPSGEAALAALAERPFDVIVSDMRMPGMDGATLLRTVQARYPEMVRIILSGYSELESSLRTLPVAHQFLSKPCEPQVLREVIERACALQALLGDAALRAAVAQLGELPARPQAYTALLRALEDPEVAMEDVARLVEQDLAISAKCLQLVNSAFFGLPRRVGTVQQAVRLLGLDMLKTLVCTAALFQTFAPRSGGPVAGLEGLQAHSLVAARLAARLLPDPARADEAFMAALLHDVGKLILATRSAAVARREGPAGAGAPPPGGWLAAATYAAEAGLPLVEAERAYLGVTHAEVGAYLLGLWGLPQPVLEAVAFHHRPEQVSSRAFDVLGAVHVADALASQALGASVSACGELDERYLDALGLRARWPEWRALAAEVAAAHAQEGEQLWR
ncbi:MAG TPA: response regulator [Chloroflexota bacterium]|jgi:HD-like signal output (HDOD) protein/CheY-like chemotaxis protein|nr:response regulator [Chloroflexota bacterium]